jgi:hypothetical protein
MARYEVRNVSENEWQKTSEKSVLEKLVENFDAVTPVIMKMMNGEEIILSHEVYRYRT